MPIVGCISIDSDIEVFILVHQFTRKLCGCTSGHAAIFIYKCPVIPRKCLYINAHPTGVRNSYVIMMACLRLDRIWHQCALSIFGWHSVLATLAHPCTAYKNGPYILGRQYTCRGIVVKACKFAPLCMYFQKMWALHNHAETLLSLNLVFSGSDIKLNVKTLYTQ